MSRTQRVTAVDLRAGRIRIPIGEKASLPASSARIRAHIRGIELESVAWDSRFGPDRERSGVLHVGSRISTVVRPDETLAFRVIDHVVTID